MDRKIRSSMAHDLRSFDGTAACRSEPSIRTPLHEPFSDTVQHGPRSGLLRRVGLGSDLSLNLDQLLADPQHIQHVHFHSPSAHRLHM